MSTIRVIGGKFLELSLSPEEVNILQEAEVRLYGVPRRHGVWRCSFRYIDKVLLHLRGWTEDNIPVGPASDILSTELKRRRESDRIKQFGATVSTNDHLWEHQRIGVELARYNKRYNFFYDTRTGKTRMLLQIMQDKLKAGEVKRCVVFVPSTIIPSWLNDAKEFPELKVAAFYGDEKQKAAALRTPAHIYLWSTGMIGRYMDTIKKAKFSLAVFDESSKAKSHKAQLSQNLFELSQTIDYWYNLSATPAPNGEYEYWYQMLYVDPASFDQRWTYFKQRYFDNVSFSDKFEKLQIKSNMQQEFMDIVEDRSIYVDQSVMPMAKSIWKPYTFKMDAYQEQIYDEMRKKSAAELTDASIVVDSAAIARAKLQQITSGFILDTDARKANEIGRRLGDDEIKQEIYKLPKNPRIAALLDLLHIIGWNQPTIIWAHYEQEFADIQKAIGPEACKVINGKTPGVDKLRWIRYFQEGSLKYLVCHPLSVGMGINLTVSHNAIYYRIVDSWEALKQSSERIKAHINIQQFDCYFWVLLATKQNGSDTVDRLVYDNVQNKRDASTGFLEYLRSGKYDLQRTTEQNV